MCRCCSLSSTKKMIEFLITEQLHVDLSKEERRKVRVNSKYFVVIGKKLFKRGVDVILVGARPRSRFL